MLPRAPEGAVQLCTILKSGLCLLGMNESKSHIPTPSVTRTSILGIKTDVIHANGERLLWKNSTKWKSTSLIRQRPPPPPDLFGWSSHKDLNHCNRWSLCKILSCAAVLLTYKLYCLAKLSIVLNGSIYFIVFAVHLFYACVIWRVMFWSMKS